MNDHLYVEPSFEQPRYVQEQGAWVSFDQSHIQRRKEKESHALHLLRTVSREKQVHQFTQRLYRHWDKETGRAHLEKKHLC